MLIMERSNLPPKSKKGDTKRQGGDYFASQTPMTGDSREEPRQPNPDYSNHTHNNIRRRTPTY